MAMGALDSTIGGMALRSLGVNRAASIAFALSPYNNAAIAAMAARSTPAASMIRMVRAPSSRVVDKSWKAKISGTAHETGTPGHRFRMYREAIAEAKKPNVNNVHLDHGYNRALGLNPKTISPNRRPDVISIYDDMSVRRAEVVSMTDDVNVLRSRNAVLDAQIRAQGFKPLPPDIVHPR